MSKAPRPATWNTRSRSWAGQDREFGQRMSASPSFSGRSSRAALGAVGGHLELALGAVAGRDDRPEHLRDDVTGLADDDGVADQHALALDLRGVVQRGQLHRGAGDLHRLHVGEGRDPAGAADVDLDVEELRRRLLRRVLERDRPARGARGRAQPPLQRVLVDLHDDAVDLVLDRVPLLLGALDELPGTPAGPRPPGSGRSPAARARAAGRTPPTAGRPRSPGAPPRRAPPAAAAGRR